MITPQKWQQLRAKMAQLEIKEEDLAENFILGSGKGGQNLHKTHSCVHLQHNPSGITVKCQKTRSREDNRYFARAILSEKIEELKFAKQSAAQQAIEKIRRQKRKRSKRAKEKILQNKHHTSKVKALRKKDF